MRDYEGYAETRRQILVEKPNIQLNWLSYAVALYLSQQYTRALDVVNSFENTSKNDKNMKLKKYERSELVLFKARILEALGEY